MYFISNGRLCFKRCICLTFYLILSSSNTLAISLGKSLFKGHTQNQSVLEANKLEEKLSLLNTRYESKIRNLNSIKLIRAHDLHDLSTNLTDEMRAISNKYPNAKNTDNTVALNLSLSEKAGVLMGAFDHLQKRGWGEMPIGMSVKNLSTIQHNEDRKAGLPNNWLIGKELAKNIYSDQEQVLLLESSARNLEETLPKKYTLRHISDNTGSKKILGEKTMWQNNLQGAPVREKSKVVNEKSHTLVHHYQSGEVKTGNFTVSRKLPK